MSARRSGIVAMMGTVAVAVVLAGTAWACTAVARVEITGPRSGVPGSETLVEGSAFEGAPVELRWNSGDGPVLATTSGPGFETSVTIPETAPGVFYVVAVQTDSKGVVWKSPASFEVVAAGQPARTAPALTGRSVNEQAASHDRGQSSAAVGVGLLSVGAAALFAGVAAVQVRRRRAVARSNATQSS